MFQFEWGYIMPIMVMSIPLVAIVGGIVHGIVRTMGRQRMMELAQRERIAAIERGLDPSKLPPLAIHPDLLDRDEYYQSAQDHARRRAQGLLIGGLVTLAVGVSMAIFLSQMAGNEPVWMVGLMPGAVGVALLLSAWILRAKENNHLPGTRP